MDNWTYDENTETHTRAGMTIERRQIGTLKRPWMLKYGPESSDVVWFVSKEHALLVGNALQEAGFDRKYRVNHGLLTLRRIGAALGTVGDLLMEGPSKNARKAWDALQAMADEAYTELIEAAGSED